MVSEAYNDLVGTGEQAETTPQADSNELLVMAMRMRALLRVTMLPSQPDKRFVRNVCGKHPRDLTERQIEHVDRLAWRYRRQLPKDVAPTTNPDLETGNER